MFLLDDYTVMMMSSSECNENVQNRTAHLTEICVTIKAGIGLMRTDW